MVRNEIALKASMSSPWARSCEWSIGPALLFKQGEMATLDSRFQHTMKGRKQGCHLALRIVGAHHNNMNVWRHTSAWSACDVTRIMCRHVRVMFHIHMAMLVAPLPHLCSQQGTIFFLCFQSPSGTAPLSEAASQRLAGWLPLSQRQCCPLALLIDFVGAQAPGVGCHGRK